MAKRQSAGILLYRGIDDVLEVLLVHPGGPFWAKKDSGAWSIPKGEYEEGDDPKACALREFNEELGPAPQVEHDGLLDLGSIKQKSGKIVRAWAAKGDFDPAQLQSNTFTMQWPPRSGTEHEFPEVDRAGWFEPSMAKKKIVEAQAVFIDQLLDHLGVEITQEPARSPADESQSSLF